MRQIRTRHLTSFLIVLVLLVAPAVVFAASVNAEEPAHSFSYLKVGHEIWLGLVVQDVNQARARQLKLPGVYGAFVVMVIPGCPAAKAGLQPNDVILDFAGKRVRTAVQLQRLIEETTPGRTVKIKISRQGKLQTLQVKVEARRQIVILKNPAMPQFRLWQGPAFRIPRLPREGPRLIPGPKGKIIPLPPATPFNNPFSAPENKLGISGVDLTPQLARFFGVKEGQGVLISRIAPGSPASAAGLKVGDAIVRVGSHEVGSMADLRWALRTQQNSRHAATLGIVRNHQEREISVLLPPGTRGAKPEPIMAKRYE